ncbi:NlpC/P60 family protein [Streptomyces sp. NPDC050560]|uniref:C40 family peptidase n=1 Tax=Streptomyces sp. NPDC050560 TaxID=3365630 RepID=UPI00379E9A82
MGAHRRTAASGHGRKRQGTRVTVLSALSAVSAVTATAATLVAPATAAPPERPPGSPAEIGRLYHEAETATEAYNAVHERVTALGRRVAGARDELARGKQRVNDLRDQIAPLARAEYRSGGVDPALRLLLSSDPDGYLDRAETLGRIGQRRVSELAALRTAQRTLSQREAETERKLRELTASRAALARHKRTVARKIAAVRRLVGHRERQGGGSAAQWPTGVSGRAAAAVAAARSAIGSPYVWGASGPNAFDCSGLMQWAYAKAGISLPRTSQQQRYAGRSVPLSQARPGDLVAYRQDASHIAMYIGGGMVVHAPHPGARVRTDPVGMLPISSVTRV